MCAPYMQLTLEQIAVVQALNVSDHCLANLTFGDVLNMTLADSN